MPRFNWCQYFCHEIARCGGPLKVVAYITDTVAIRALTSRRLGRFSRGVTLDAKWKSRPRLPARSLAMERRRRCCNRSPFGRPVRNVLGPIEIRFHIGGGGKCARTR